MGNLALRIGRETARQPRFASGNASIPAPVLGWNARDNLADMDPRFALLMSNYFPDGSQVNLRRGAQDHATGLPSFVETLHNWVSGTSSKLLAFSGGGVYEVTGSGAVGAPLATGFSNNRWSAVNAGATGGERGLYANGADAAQSYDGATFTAAGLSGPTKLNGLAVVNKRLWGYDEGTGQAWYWPVEAVTGAGASFDIASVVPTGGTLVAIGNLTVDGGLGLNDLTVFVLSSGKIVIYQGTDPADAANWSLVGVWDGGLPIGKRCLVPFGNDLVLISEAGFLSLLRFTRQTGVIEASPLSDAIRDAVNDASQLYENNFGWQGIYYPHLRQLIFNIPRIENKSADQYVMNSFTGAWCRFKGWDASCFETRGHDLFFGANNKVVKANIGGNDFGGSILASWQSAWNYFGSRGVEKIYTQYRPNIRSTALLEVSTAVGTDFDDPVLPGNVLTSQPIGGRWNVDKWNTARWNSGETVYNEWVGAGNEGFNASVLYRTNSLNAQIRFLATDFLYEFGGNL